MRAVGSTWRRWDLHIHTPDTILNDQFGDWDEFLTAIEGQDSVKVLGVTDYLSIANYSKLKQNKKAGRIPGIDLLIPTSNSALPRRTTVPELSTFTSSSARMTPTMRSRFSTPSAD